MATLTRPSFSLPPVVVLSGGPAYFPLVAAAFNLRAFQGLLLLLLAAIALQVGSAASDGERDYAAQVHGSVFRADTPEAALLPIRLDWSVVEAPDTGPNLTDDLTRGDPTADLAALCCGLPLPDQTPAHAALDGLHRIASLPRAPPVS